MATYEEYNAGRLARGRSTIREETFNSLEDVGVFTKALEGFVVASEAVYAVKLVKAAEVADYWRSIAPHWGDMDPKGARPPTGLGGGGTGVPNDPDDYAASIKVMRMGHGRVAVGSELMPLAEFLEYGTSKMEEAACGARTLAHFGGEEVERNSRERPNERARITHSLFVA